MEIKFSKLDIPESGTLVFLIAKDSELSAKLKDIDSKIGGAIAKSIKSADFNGKKGEILSVLGVSGNLDRIVLLGVGDRDKAEIKTEVDLQKLGGTLFSKLDGARIKEASIVVEEPVGGFSPDFVASSLAYGAKLKSYRFDKYFTKQKDEDKQSLSSLTFLINAEVSASSKYDMLEKIADGVFLSRDVISEPSNVIYPESYVEVCKELKSLGIKVEVFGEKDLKKLGMNALLGVGQGSARESHVVVMQWNGREKNTGSKPIAFVGKGVTFDTGGISIKPSNGMEEMKYDMAGSGAVVGLMKALAGRKANVNAIGVIGLVENMPGGEAQRPGDVVTSMSGQTIEVLNTDAEGRLVLADILWYTQNRFNPRFMVNLATLTGAIVVTLGVHRAGLFSNDDELADRLKAAGCETGEKLWRLPLGDEYDKQIDSKIADVQNISNISGGGSITAAQFLKRFVNDVPWAHLDIAGTAWTKKNLDVSPKGATGFGVRLLDKLVANHYED